MHIEATGSSLLAAIWLPRPRKTTWFSEMPCCVAYNCSNRQENQSDNGNKKTFHRFPQDPLRRKIWIQNLRRQNFTPSKYSRLCSDHFHPDCLYSYKNSTRLREDAVPTIFSFPRHLQKVLSHRKTPIARSLVETSKPSLETETKEESSSQTDHSYCIQDSPRTLKRKLEESYERQETLQKRLKTSQQCKRRLKEKVTSLQIVVDKLKDEKLISESGSIILENCFSGSSLQVMKQLVKGHPANKYPPELRSFATTLNFYSSKAYNFVRETFQLSLPHPSQIRRWYSKIPCEPGFTEPSFKSLQDHVEKLRLENKVLLCSLTFDEMAIKQHVQWDGQQFRGFVDIGNGANNDDNNPKAKDVLVFMVVALNAGWKVPVAYFFIDGLTGSEKANLVKECLIRLSNIGVNIHSVTCDGPSSHFSMFQILGATLKPESLNPSFNHPNAPHKVHIVLDVCHMLKLVRNTFADGGILKNKEGQLIKWDYLKQLHNLQEQEGLRLANKVRSSHIDGWKRQK